MKRDRSMIVGRLHACIRTFLPCAIGIAIAACRNDPAAAPSDGSSADRDAAAALVCTVQAPTACPDPPPRYADVSPIFQERCVPCHFGAPEGPWPLLEYRHVADWYDVVRADVLSCRMPPAENGVPITDQERVAILTWILCGLPE